MMNNHNPFALSQITNPLLRRVIQKISKLDVLASWYQQWLDLEVNKADSTDKFITHAMAKLKVDSELINAHKVSEIPEKGAFIVVANHPLGAVEGLVLTQLLRSVRTDVKVLTNEMLTHIPEFADVFVGVDVLNKNRAQHNSKGIRVISKHLADGGAVLVFPAGTVSGVKLPSLSINDAPWNPFIARLARKFNASVMPVYVEGRNPLWFYLSAYIHKRLRTILLPRAMVSAGKRKIRFHLSSPINATDLKRMPSDAAAIDYLRVCCKVVAKAKKELTDSKLAPMDAIKAAPNQQAITQQLQSLTDYQLCQNDSFTAYCAPYHALGVLMDVISIERERTFRTVDEGTGKELDSDQFDPHYMHLFLWDHVEQRLVGGYRLGKTDEIIKSRGLNGLYSHSLFDYNRAFIANMGKTIEVGRSFVAKDYQKNPLALDMLWKGIGHFVVKHPQYHTLFGCVSISRQYSKLARAMLADTFLSHYGVASSVAKKVRARAPLKKINKPWTDDQIANLSEVPIINKLVGRIDPGKSVPVLIRHYLALNGRFVSFTVNNSFNDSLDGLILVDLRNTSRRYLKRYMGQAGLQQFLTAHQTSELPKAS